MSISEMTNEVYRLWETTGLNVHVCIKIVKIELMKIHVDEVIGVK